MTNTRLIDGLNEAIRENPLAASLVGAGVFWMLFGNKMPGAARSVGETLTSAGQKIIDATSETASDVAQRASDVAQRVSDTARSAGDAARGMVPSSAPGADRLEAMKDTSAEALRSGAETGQRILGKAQQHLSESLERQPLLLGALGLAIGAGVASAFPATDFERETLGAHATAARDALETAAADAKDFALERGREVLRDVQQEAQAQGLTTEAAKQGWEDVSSRVKNVAGAARDSVAGRVS